MLRRIQADPDLSLHLIVGGMHLSPEFGLSVNAIERDGFPIGDRVEMLLSSDTPIAVAKSMGLGVIGFAESYARKRPDLLLAMGDRFEMHAAVLAAVPFGIPIAHIHGGEVTTGAIDDALRHGISKFAHLHFPATADYADRLRRLGEEPWRITVSGAPSLDNLAGVRLLDRAELATRLNVPVEPSALLVTYHPTTLEQDRIPAQIEALLDALRRCGRPILFTLPNADPGGRLIAARIREFAAREADAYVVDNLGTQTYFSAMNAVAAMVGNSSSGIIEAASFGLPVVNIGSRQDGRARNRNVVDVSKDEDADEIQAAITRAVAPGFREGLSDRQNLYGNGTAAETIVRRLREATLGPALLRKIFYDG